MGDVIMSPPSINGANSEVASISAKIMVIAMIVLFFVVAFCFFLSLYARWYWSRNEDPSMVSWRRRTARQGLQARAAPKRRGLDQETLGALPVVVYDPKDFKEELECSVCLSEISQGEKVRLLPKCNHGFHVECIDMWFKSHSTCPLCRNSVVSTTQNQENSSSHELQEVEVTRSLSDSDSDSDSNSDSDNEDGSHETVVHIGETPSFPTNILFWGNEVQVRSLGETTNGVATSSSSNVGVASQRDEMVIDIPTDLCDDCSPSPPSRREIDVDEAKTPVVSRLKSFKRLLSRGKRVAPWASGSNSADIEAV